MRSRWAAALLAAFLGTAPLVASPVASAAVTQGAGHSSFAADACTDSSGVTVVVDFAELGGGVIVACASGLTARSRGSDALAAAGISWSPPANQPGFVCRLAGRPSADEVFGTTGQADYQETCVDTPPADAHWSYWQSSGDGSWAYGDSGLTSSRVNPGGFEGWSFSTGALLPPDYNPVSGGGEPEPLPQPEPQPVPPPQPQPEPEPELQPQPEQPVAPAPAPQAPAAPAPEPEPAQTTAAASPETTAVESTTVADSASASARTASSAATTSSVSASPRSSGPSTSTSVAVTALADPAAEADSGGGGWVLGGLALIAALAAAAFVVVRHRRHG